MTHAEESLHNNSRAGGSKTLVARDFMEQLSGRFKSVGLFRPDPADGGGPDLIIALMRSLYHLPFPAEDLHGVTEAAVAPCGTANLVRNGRSGVVKYEGFYIEQHKFSSGPKQ